MEQIYDAPKVLYAIGNINLLKSTNNIAIIGSRKCSDYGIKATLYFSKNLAKLGFTIISGLAIGIDGYAHRGALEVQGKTIAVIPSGLNHIYPKIHRDLANKIIKNKGLILSEYPPETQINAKNFYGRNRIISGLSKAVLVIEANEKSGTLITINHALDQGREVLAVPNNINYINSKGVNNLIKDGATLVMNYKDVIKEII